MSTQQSTNPQEIPFTVIDKNDFDQTQHKVSNIKSLIYGNDGLSEDEKSELLKHIDEMVKDNLGVE